MICLQAHESSTETEPLTTVVTSLRLSQSSLTREQPVSAIVANTEEGTGETPEMSSVAAACSSGQQVMSLTTFSSRENYESSSEREPVTTVLTSLGLSQSSLTREQPVSAIVANTEEISSVAAACSCGQQVMSFTTCSSRENYEALHNSTEVNAQVAAAPNAGNENIVQVQEETVRRPDTFRENKPPNNTTQGVNHSEDYLQPVEHLHLQAAFQNGNSSRCCRGKIQTLPQGRPVPKPRGKLSTFAGMTSNSRREGVQQRADVERVNQSRFCTPHPRVLQGEHSYLNDRCAATPYESPSYPQSVLPSTSRRESPYTKVLNNTNWEVPGERLRLFKRIGGGTFGQVWEGAVLDVRNTQGWSIVAVKMLKGTCYC